MFEFKEFPKIARLNREVIVTEKLDGTNACVIVSDDGTEIAAQSRSKLITPEDDNYGFAGWVQRNKEELLRLGPGHHFGEWWGNGIQRKYNVAEKRFSLFNTSRWGNDATRPACCHVVPVLMVGTPSQGLTVAFPALELLRSGGSVAAPGFMKPEGIVCFHVPSQLMFKATLEKDEEYKGKSK